MHWTRQQRRLAYTLAAFFFMSWNFSSFLFSMLPWKSFYLLPGVLFIWVMLGLYWHQEDLPWEIPLYFALLKALPLLPLAKLCRGNITAFTLVLLIALSYGYVFFMRKESIGELFTGNLQAKLTLPSLSLGWWQGAGILASLLILGFVFRGVLLMGRFPRVSLGLVQHAFLMALYTSLAVFSVPIVFLKRRMDKDEVLLCLALGFGLFERYFMIGSFFNTLILLALGWALARMSYETRGVLLSAAVIFVYILTMVM